MVFTIVRRDGSTQQVPDNSLFDYYGLKIQGDNREDWNEPLEQNFVLTINKVMDLEDNLTTLQTSVSQLNKTDLNLNNVDNTSDAAKPISTATQLALDLKANLASPTFTGIVTLPSTTSIGNISNIELSYLDGATSNIQAQLNAINSIATINLANLIN